MTSLLRVRIVLVGLAMAIIAVVAGGVFDQITWSLAIPVALPVLFAIAFRSLPGSVRLLGAVVAIAGSIATVVAVEGGGANDGVDAVVAGAQRMLTTEWPSPIRPDLVGTVALLLAVATAISAELAGRQRTHLVAWLPIIASSVVVVALSAPLGTRLIWLLPLALIGAVFAALRPSTVLSERWAILRGERRVVPLLLVAGIIAAAMSIPVALTARADPRRNEPAVQTAPLLDPIESTLALRTIDPPIDLHEITSTDGALLPRRWRTAALSDYDGQRWTPALTLRPIGRRLAPDRDDAIAVDVAFLDDDLVLVPLPGAPVTVDSPVETDVDRTVVRLSERRGTEPLALTSAVAPVLADAVVGGIATRPVDDSVTSLSEFATTLAGDGTVLEQLRQIESTMRDEWILESDAPGGGLQRALIERFIRDTQRGTAEQFATSYVLLARSLGVDARVATGFATDASAGGTVVLTSADAEVWPEVRLAGGGWVALDPVPPQESSDETPPQDDPAVQTPTAAQPPIAPPPEVTSDTTTDDELDDEAQARSLSTIALWARRVGIGISSLLLPLVAATLLILGIKRRRRRRRLRGEAGGRVTGAWAVATDRLVDAGLTIGPAATNGDIAASGAGIATGSERELHRLATLSSAVTFGRPGHADLLADDAAACLQQVEEKMAAERTRTERLRWRLSLRSLRRATRSPVAD